MQTDPVTLRQICSQNVRHCHTARSSLRNFLPLMVTHSTSSVHEHMHSGGGGTTGPEPFGFCQEAPGPWQVLSKCLATNAGCPNGDPRTLIPQGVQDPSPLHQELPMATQRLTARSTKAKVNETEINCVGRVKPLTNSTNRRDASTNRTGRIRTDEGSKI